MLTNNEFYIYNNQPTLYKALCNAAQSGYTNCVALLVKHILYDLQIKNQFTALMMAAHNGHTECVKLLIPKEVKKEMNLE